MTPFSFFALHWWGSRTKHASAACKESPTKNILFFLDKFFFHIYYMHHFYLDISTSGKNTCLPFFDRVYRFFVVFDLFVSLIITFWWMKIFIISMNLKYFHITINFATTLYFHPPVGHFTPVKYTLSVLFMIPQYCHILCDKTIE